jgi:hypothetical protein
MEVGFLLSTATLLVSSGSEDVCHLVRVPVREDGARFSGPRPLIFTLRSSAEFPTPHFFILLLE